MDYDSSSTVGVQLFQAASNAAAPAMWTLTDLDTPSEGAVWVTDPVEWATDDIRNFTLDFTWRAIPNAGETAASGGVAMVVAPSISGVGTGGTNVGYRNIANNDWFAMGYYDDTKTYFFDDTGGRGDLGCGTCVYDNTHNLRVTWHRTSPTDNTWDFMDALITETPGTDHVILDSPTTPPISFSPGQRYFGFTATTGDGVNKRDIQILDFTYIIGTFTDPEDDSDEGESGADDAETGGAGGVILILVVIGLGIGGIGVGVYSLNKREGAGFEDLYASLTSAVRPETKQTNHGAGGRKNSTGSGRSARSGRSGRSGRSRGRSSSHTTKMSQKSEVPRSGGARSTMGDAVNAIVEQFTVAECNQYCKYLLKHEMFESAYGLALKVEEKAYDTLDAVGLETYLESLRNLKDVSEALGFDEDVQSIDQIVVNPTARKEIRSRLTAAPAFSARKSALFTKKLARGDGGLDNIGGGGGGGRKRSNSKKGNRAAAKDKAFTLNPVEGQGGRFNKLQKGVPSAAFNVALEDGRKNPRETKRTLNPVEGRGGEFNAKYANKGENTGLDLAEEDVAAGFNSDAFRAGADEGNEQDTALAVAETSGARDKSPRRDKSPKPSGRRGSGAGKRKRSNSGAKARRKSSVHKSVAAKSKKKGREMRDSRMDWDPFDSTFIRQSLGES